MKFKKTIAAVLATASIMTALSGCEQGYDSLLDKNDPVTVTIWHYYNGVQQTMLDEMITEFNNTLGMEKGIIVEAFSKNTISELSDKVLAAAKDEVGAEELPDIFASYAETAYIVDKHDKLADISKYFTDEELAEYVPAYIEEGKFADSEGLKIFPVAKSTEVMILNKTDWDKFAEATEGVSLDMLFTWEGLSDVSAKYYEYTDNLTPDVAGDGKAFFGRDSMGNYMTIGAKQLGSPFVTDDNGKISAVCDKDAVKQLWKNYYVPYVNGYFTANSRFRSDDAKTGAIICLICSTTGAAYQPYEVTIDDDNSYPIENLVLPVPDFEGKDSYVVQQGAGMCIVKGEEKQEYASAVFLKWFTEEERNIRFSINSGYLPVKTAANNEEKIAKAATENETKQIVAETLDIAVDEVNTRNLYTAPAFDNTIYIRDFLSTYMQQTADADRNAAYERIALGEDRNTVMESLTNDAAFETWFKGFEEGYNKAAQGN